MSKIDKLFPDLVSNELYDKLSLDSNEMKRRRFLLKKSNLNEKQTRELEILNVRCFLYTKEQIKNKNI